MTLSFEPFEQVEAEQKIVVTVVYGGRSAIAPEFTVESSLGPQMDVWTENSNVNVFRDAVMDEFSDTSLSYSCVRNEFESAQILLRGTAGFTINSVSFTDLQGPGDAVIGNENFKFNYVEYEYLTSYSSGQNSSTAVGKIPGYFPEALSNELTVEVEKNCTQPVWVRVYVPKDVPAGEYAGTATVETTIGTYEIPVAVNVYQVTIPDAKDGEFGFSFWSNVAGLWEANDEKDQTLILYGYERYSDNWWQLVDDIAQLMKDNRSNNLYINPLTLVKDGPGTTLDENGDYVFDWTRFDEYIQFFIDKGVVKNLEGMTLLACVYGSDYRVYTLVGEAGEKLRRETKEYDDPISQKWLEQFIPAYVQHITEKGWDEIWIQHIGDEPFDVPAQMTKWAAVRDMIHEVNPKIRCGDAVDNQGAFNAIQKLDSDIYFPILSVHEDSIARCDELRAEGKEVYMYTCLNPQGGWLNRYVDKAVWQMKTIGWLSYLHGATGHLHWGFNEWFKNATTIMNEIPGQSWKGDNYTIHPDVDYTTNEQGEVTESTPRRPKVKSSIRYDAVRDACEDYEIFNILEQRDKLLAKEIAGSIVTTGNQYVTDTDVMVAQRKRLLEEASIAALSVPVQQQEGGNVGEVVFTFAELPQGNHYYYKITANAADSALTSELLGCAKPDGYEAELISGSAIEAENGVRLNIIEMGANGLVRAYATLVVEKSRRPMASSVPFSVSFNVEEQEDGTLKAVFETEALGKEKVFNGDFELGEEGWANIKFFAVEDGTGVDGSKSAVNGPQEGGSYQVLSTPLLPDTTYYFSAQGNKAELQKTVFWVGLPLRRMAG